MRKSAPTMLVALTLLCIICSAGFAAVETVTAPPEAVCAGWNLFAIPAVPVALNGNPPGYPPDVLDEFVADGTGLDGRLFRWDSHSQTLLAWDSQDSEAVANFGNLLINGGYWFALDPADTAQVSFTGITDNDAIDMWIPLPKAGWAMVGYPYSRPSPELQPPYYSGTPYLWSDVKVTDGIMTKGLYDASQYGEGWVYSVAFWWDSGTQSLMDMGVPDDLPSCESLTAWRGYWVRTFKDNLALMMECPPQP